MRVGLLTLIGIIVFSVISYSQETLNSKVQNLAEMYEVWRHDHEEELQGKLSLSDFFNHPTLRLSIKDQKDLPESA